MATVDQLTIDERLQRLAVSDITFALPDDRTIVLKAQPGEVFQDGRLVLGARTLAIVVLDAKQDPAIAVVRGVPHVEGIHDVAKVQIARRGGRKAGNHGPPEDILPPLDAAVVPLDATGPATAAGIGV